MPTICRVCRPLREVDIDANCPTEPIVDFVVPKPPKNQIVAALSNQGVIAEGKLLPGQYANLSFATNGKVAEGIRAQTMQVLENVKTALAFAGGGFEHVVKITSYLVDLERDGAAFREVRASYFPNKAALPASTLLQVSRLANPAYLLEIDVIAVLPPKA